MAILNNSNAISSGGYDINNSLRFRSSASAYLNRTPASAGNRQIFTWSGWVKRGALDSGSEYTLFSAGAGSPNYDSFRFTINQLQFFQGAGSVSAVQTTQVFRDPSAWYHLVLAVDTTQATAANRIKMYVNGNQITAFASAAYPTQNTSATINNTNAHAVGALWITSPQQYIDGYLAEVNFIDGQQLTPSSFGETDTTTGSWKPKAYTGTYGTNGFYLKFSDIATTSGSNAGLGKDFSGNANYWTTNNISVTAGTTYDAMIDSPTLTSATVANYAVLNPLLRLNGIVGTFTNGNLNFLAPTAADYYYCSTMFTGTTGKYYSEATINAIGSGILIGLINEAQVGTAWGNKSAYRETGAIYDLSGTAVTSGSTFTTGDVIGIAVDIGAGTVQFYKNNVAQGATPSFSFTAGTPLAFAGRSNNGNADVAFNFGQRPFSYTPPSGFVRLNTFNLPDSTIVKGNLYMDSTLYTGNGSNRSITNASSFRPDLVIGQARSAAYGNWWYDSVRGATKQIESFSTNAESTQATMLTAFNSNGFSMGTDTAGNQSSITYVGWQWQAGQGSTSSNTSGSITSTVSVSTTAGFSIVTFTGTGANATVGHGLGVAPKFMAVKNRTQSAVDWPTYHIITGNTGGCTINETGATVTAAGWWNNTTPTSTVFSVGSATQTNGSTRPMVAYCWAEIAGFSKFGSYTGNGSADGPFVFLGFRPEWILVKQSSSAGNNWQLLDSARNTYNKADNALFPNTAGAETTGNATFDFLSNGFKVRTTDGTVNTSSSTYIYAAYAENPFKNANAR